MGMHISHIMASGMGGIRTAGDLVAWMQMTRRMKINEAKAYVAGKLGIDIIDLTDEEVMHQLREDLGIVLGIRINSVELFRSQTGYGG